MTRLVRLHDTCAQSLCFSLAYYKPGNANHIKPLSHPPSALSLILCKGLPDKKKQRIEKACVGERKVKEGEKKMREEKKN